MTSNRLSRYWLLLGVTALAIAGLFSLVLVVARTPALSSIAGLDAFFREALVVHVDLSVLVWFLCIACLMWSLLAQGSRQVFPYLEEAALVCFGLGTLAIAAAPLDPQSTALMSNYIPVIYSPVFFIGLALLLSGVGLMLVRGFTSGWSPLFERPLQFGIFSAGLIAVMAGAAFIWSYHQMPSGFDGESYYDLMFWGGGHVLQLVHTQVMMVCWLLLIQALAMVMLPSRVLYALFAIGLVAAFITPLPYLMFNVNSLEHRMFFTHAMIWAGGIAPTVLAVLVLPVLLKIKIKKNALWASLFMSILLFIYGGALGGMIQGQNVVIPAHYHGSIVGVTLAFMGIAYLLLPQFGYREAAGWKIAFWQPVVYGSGQLLHISGLAWSGGYGVLRKTPGGLEALPMNVKAAMGLMALGGTIAIIGGFMFVIVIARAVWRRPVG